MSVGGGSPDTTVKDTPEARHLASIAAKEWNFAQEELAPLQDHYMDKVNDLDSQERKDFIQGVTNISARNASGDSADQLVKTAGANEVDVDSGAFKFSLADAAIDTASIGGEVTARALHEQDAQKVVGKQNVVAMGAGKQTKAMAGLGDIAQVAGHDARQDVVNEYRDHTSTMDAIGQVAGAATRHAMQPGAEMGSNMDLYGTDKPSLSSYNIL